MQRSQEPLTSHPIDAKGSLDLSGHLLPFIILTFRQSDIFFHLLKPIFDGLRWVEISKSEYKDRDLGLAAHTPLTPRWGTQQTYFTTI